MLERRERVVSDVGKVRVIGAGKLIVTDVGKVRVIGAGKLIIIDAGKSMLES
jgi:hypothetical protein